MLDSPVSVEAPEDAITGIRPTVSSENPSQRATSVTKPQPPVLITEQEVMLGTAAVVKPRPTPITGRRSGLIGRLMVNALHGVGAALRPPPPRPHYAHRAAYIERAAMAREMDRL
jgi:hypothetical protein